MKCGYNKIDFYFFIIEMVIAVLLVVLAVESLSLYDCYQSCLCLNVVCLFHCVGLYERLCH